MQNKIKTANLGSPNKLCDGIQKVKGCMQG